MKGILSVIKELLCIALIVLFIQTFTVIKTHIPSGSMIPTINIDDQLLVTQVPMYYRNPKSGEIIVFDQGGELMIKRVIAVGGQEIDIKEGFVYIDGVRQEEPYLAQEGITHPYAYSSTQITYPYEVPEGYYFMMGDNRTNSQDSRHYGAVRRKDIVALAGVRIYPFDAIGQVK